MRIGIGTPPEDEVDDAVDKPFPELKRAAVGLPMKVLKGVLSTDLLG